MLRLIGLLRFMAQDRENADSSLAAAVFAVLEYNLDQWPDPHQHSIGLWRDGVAAIGYGAVNVEWRLGDSTIGRASQWTRRECEKSFAQVVLESTKTSFGAWRQG